MALLTLDTLCIVIIALVFFRTNRMWLLSIRLFRKTVFRWPSFTENIDTDEDGSNVQLCNQSTNDGGELNGISNEPKTQKSSFSLISQRVILNKMEYGPEFEIMLTGSLIVIAAFFVSDVGYCLTNNSVLNGRQLPTSLLVVGMTFHCVRTLRWVTGKMIPNMANKEGDATLVSFLVAAFITFALLAYSSFSSNIEGMEQAQNIIPDLNLINSFTFSPEMVRKPLWWGISIMLSLISGIIAALCLIGALRFARLYNEVTTMHVERGKVCPTSSFLVLCWHINLLAPLFVVLLYVEPMVAQPVIESFRIDRQGFVKMRSLIVLATCTFRLAMLPQILQAFEDSSFLVIKYMCRDQKNYPRSDIVAYSRNHYRLSAYVALQYCTCALIPFFLTLLQHRIANISYGCCDAFWSHVLPFERPLQTVKSPGIAVQLVENLLNEFSFSVVENGEVLFSDFLNVVCSTLIFTFHMFWFAGTLVGIAHFRVELDSIRKIAQGVIKKDN